MRQLLIAKSIKAAGTSIDTSGYVPANGELAVYSLSFYETITSVPTENFAIALGRPNDQMPFTISEVDLKSLSVNVAKPSSGTHFKVTFTMPTPVIGKEYTLRFFKKGVVPHERNSWTVTIVAKSTTANQEAARFADLINKMQSDKFRFTATVSGSTLTITADDYQMWEVKTADELSTLNLVENTNIVYAIKPIGDKDYVQDLASKCAAGKGFTDTYAMGPSTIPGYPETVEDGSYTIYTLRFKVGRDSAKTRDERVWQIVHIATSDSATATALNTMFTNNIEKPTIDEPSED